MFVAIMWHGSRGGCGSGWLNCALLLNHASIVNLLKCGALPHFNEQSVACRLGQLIRIDGIRRTGQVVVT